MPKIFSESELGYVVSSEPAQIDQEDALDVPEGADEPDPFLDELHGLMAETAVKAKIGASILLALGVAVVTTKVGQQIAENIGPLFENGWLSR